MSRQVVLRSSSDTHEALRRSRTNLQPSTKPSFRAFCQQFNEMHPAEKALLVAPPKPDWRALLRNQSPIIYGWLALMLLNLAAVLLLG